MLAAYEYDPGSLPQAVLVFGPFMMPDRQAAFAARAARLPNVRTLTFDAHLEGLIVRAGGIVAMGGYNTFCEILSFDKPALIVPRTTPRLEQYIRAQRAAELGLVAMLPDNGSRDPREMAAALLRLAHQPRPSTVVVPGLLDGMEAVNRLALKWLAAGRPARWARGAAQAALVRATHERCRAPAASRAGRVAFVLKGYPRLSETFIAQEIAALERRGLDIQIVSLRHPTDRARHPVHERIRAPILYLPEYLKDAPRRVLAGWRRGSRTAGLWCCASMWLADLARDPTPNRVRRWGQALVLAAELPSDIGHVHAHFLHTPASVARYAATMRGFAWSVSAHAKDIWTTPDWEKRAKLASVAWAATCTGDGRDHLAALGAVAGYRQPRLSRARLRPLPAAAPRCRQWKMAAIRRGRSSSCRSDAPSRRKDMTICWRRSRCCRPVWLGASSISAAARWRIG